MKKKLLRLKKSKCLQIMFKDLLTKDLVVCREYNVAFPSSTEGGIWRSCCDQVREIVLRRYPCLISSCFFSFFSRLHVAFLTRAERTKQCYLNWEKKGISRETSHQTSYHRYDLNIRSPSSCLVEGSPSMRRREPSHDTSLFGRRRNMSSMTTIGED